MARTTKTAKSDRRAVIDQIRNEQKGAERRRGLMIVGVCVVVALLIVLAAAYKPLKDAYDLRQFKDKDLADIGAPASVCGEETTANATGTQDHVQPGTPINYTDSPPAFGQHYNVWDSMDRKLYTADDRPDLGELVHNEEHGYTILWYDDTAAGDSDQMDQIRAIAGKFAGTTDLRDKFKAVPWTSSDGKPFPGGQHVAFTHWSVGGTQKASQGSDKQVGVWQYCSSVSGAALETYMEDYPFSDSPEPAGM